MRENERMATHDGLTTEELEKIGYTGMMGDCAATIAGKRSVRNAKRCFKRLVSSRWCRYSFDRACSGYRRASALTLKVREASTQCSFYSPMLCGLVLIAASAYSSAAEFHVAPHGTAAGKGSAENPWDLATGLSARAALKPGDVLWLHAGLYRGGFKSELVGSPDSPIVVRCRPGERVTIDTRPRDRGDHGSFLLTGADTTYRDFEVTCSDPQRVTTIPGSWPEDIRRGSIDVRGSRLSLINLVVHELGCGFGFWSEGEGGEISGCLIYNNGWQGPDRAHGHGIYAQNARGTKQIADNVVILTCPHGWNHFLS